MSPATTIEAIAALGVVAIALAGRMLWLHTGDERRQRIMGLAVRRRARGALLGLRVRRLLIVLRLVALLLLLVVLRPSLRTLRLLTAAIRLRLLARRIRLRLAAEVRLALRHRLRLALQAGRGLSLRRLDAVVAFEVVVLIGVGGAGHGRRLVVRILLAELLLGSGDQAEVVLGMLVVVFGGDRVAGGSCVAGELKVLLGDVVGGSADLHVRAVRLVDPRQGIVMAAAATVMLALVSVATAHALVLTVSHVACCPLPYATAAGRLFVRNPSVASINGA